MAAAIDKPAEFTADGVYSLSDVKRILGLGRDALRTARRGGLIVRRVGRRSFILGSDLLAYVREHGKVVS